MTVRIEYVGVIAVACLAAGVIIGSGFVGSNHVPLRGPSVASEKPGLEAMIAQIDKIDDFDQLVQLGNQAYDNHNPHVAIPAYEKALRIRPSDPDVLTDLGVMYRQVGDYRQAVDRFRKAMAVDSKHAFSRFNLGIVLMHDIKDYRGAREAFEAFLRIKSVGPEADEARKSIEQLKKLEKSG